MTHAAVIAILVLISPLSAFGQQRPLVTEDPETVGAGRILVEAGFDYARNVLFPTSGLEGHRLRVPVAGISIGVSSIAEIQVDGGVYSRLAIERRTAGPLASMVTSTGDMTSAVEDIVIGTKVRLVPEGVSRPAFGFRFATKLPNASNESGLGRDTMDFFASLLVAKTVESVRVVGNAGLGILSDVTRGDEQNDVLIYGLSFARAITQAAEVVGELNGRLDLRDGAPPPGTDSSGTIRFGTRYTRGSWRADTAILIGVTSKDPTVGLTAGFTYVFAGFQVP